MFSELFKGVLTCPGEGSLAGSRGGSRVLEGVQRVPEEILVVLEKVSGEAEELKCDSVFLKEIPRFQGAQGGSKSFEMGR